MVKQKLIFVLLFLAQFISTAVIGGPKEKEAIKRLQSDLSYVKAGKVMRFISGDRGYVLTEVTLTPEEIEAEIKPINLEIKIAEYLDKRKFKEAQNVIGALPHNAAVLMWAKYGVYPKKLTENLSTYNFEILMDYDVLPSFVFMCRELELDKRGITIFNDKDALYLLGLYNAFMGRYRRFVYKWVHGRSTFSFNWINALTEEQREIFDKAYNYTGPKFKTVLEVRKYFSK